MRSKLATCFLIGLTAVGCARRSNDKGLGAGADSAGLRDTMYGRDTGMVTPGTATPVDTGRTKPVTPEKGGASGGTMTGDTATRHKTSQKLSSGNSITDSLNRAQLQKIQGNDTMPARQDSAGRSDSAKPLGTDTLHRWRSDSVTPVRDSTKRDSVPR